MSYFGRTSFLHARKYLRQKICFITKQITVFRYLTPCVFVDMHQSTDTHDVRTHQPAIFTLSAATIPSAPPLTLSLSLSHTHTRTHTHTHTQTHAVSITQTDVADPNPGQSTILTYVGGNLFLLSFASLKGKAFECRVV